MEFLTFWMNSYSQEFDHLEVESEDKLPFPGLALTHQEHAVARGRVVEHLEIQVIFRKYSGLDIHHGSCFTPGECSMEPWVVGEDGKGLSLPWTHARE